MALLKALARRRDESLHFSVGRVGEAGAAEASRLWLSHCFHRTLALAILVPQLSQRIIRKLNIVCHLKCFFFGR